MRRRSFPHCLAYKGDVGVGLGRSKTQFISLLMKTILLVSLLACALSIGACSRSDKPDASQSTPNPNLKSDADRLQQATAKAAAERKRAEGSPAPTPGAP